MKGDFQTIKENFEVKISKNDYFFYKIIIQNFID